MSTLPGHVLPSRSKWGNYDTHLTTMFVVKPLSAGTVDIVYICWFTTEK